MHLEDSVSPFRQSFILRDVPEPLWDAEIITSDCPAVNFFRRQIGQCMNVYRAGTKGFLETNMCQPGQLDNPIEFLATGFNLFFERGTDSKDIDEILNKGAFEFTFAGNRVYLRMPLFLFSIKDVPDTERLSAEIRVKKEKLELAKKELLRPDWDMLVYHEFKDEAKRAAEREDGMIHLGRKPLRIRSTESFGTRIFFDVNKPKLSAPVKVWSFIEGRKFFPL
jgi:hypothetical protein